MRRMILNVAVALAVIGGMSLGAVPARADYAVWQDSKTGASLSYPDTWRSVASLQPDDLVTIAAPSKGEHAQCRLKARPERRYMVYPASLASAVQKRAVSQAFWDKYLAQYDNVSVSFLTEDGGFGRGHGSVSSASFTIAHPQTGMPRSGILAASLYRDYVYILECTVDPQAFEYWRPVFLGILKSIDMPKRAHESVGGDYADRKRMDFLFKDKTRNAYFSE